MNSENYEINGKTLKHYRKVHRGITQEELARLMGVDANTVSRWERGEVKVKSNNQQTLADELGVPLIKLRAPIPVYKEENPDERISLTISKEATVALDIVSETYHINKDAIMDIAPFMFHVIAAASLGQRSTKLDEMDKEIEEFQEYSKEKLPYMPDGLFIEKSMAGGSLLEERESIDNNKLFFSEDYHIPDDISDISTNPFAQFLKSFIVLMPEKLSELLEVEWRNDDLPRYHIADKKNLNKRI